MRHGKGVLELPDGMKFEGSYVEDRPQPGGTFTFSDHTKTTFVVDPRFAPYLGPGSNPAGYETVMIKLMQHWKTTQANDGGDEDEDTEFGFGDDDGFGDDADADEEENAFAEELASDEEWEEVDVDEYGNVLEHTARPVAGP